MAVLEDAPMPWVDSVICARKPSFPVLLKYGMIVPLDPANEAISVLFGNASGNAAGARVA